ncbi:DinB family protein [Anaerolineales bacterium]
MSISFDKVSNGDMNFYELSKSVSVADLKEAVNKSIDHLLGAIDGLPDAFITFEPVDPEADDPYAVEGEEKIGWTIGHIIVHVTASAEEGAAMSSQLARGIEVKLRNRYETPWQEMTTQEQCVQRLEESRRMRLGFLETWPDTPHLDVFRKISQEFEDKFGPLNAPAMFLFSHSHELGHYTQIEDVIEQAKASLGLNA